MSKKDHFGVKIVISHKRQLTKLELINQDSRKKQNNALKISEKDQFFLKYPKKPSQNSQNKTKEIHLFNINGDYLSPIKRPRPLALDKRREANEPRQENIRQKYPLVELQRSKTLAKYQVVNSHNTLEDNDSIFKKPRSLSCQHSKSKLKTSHEFLNLRGQKVGCKVLQGFKQQKKIKALFNTLMSRQISYNSTSNSKPNTPMSSQGQRKHRRIQSSVEFKIKESKQIKPMNFSPEKYYQQEYQRRLKYFKDFLFRILFFHRIGKNLTMKNGPIHKYKVCVKTSYSDAQLIKNIFRKRFWYEIVEEHEACHIIWSDNHEKQVFKRQRSMKINKRYQQQLFHPINDEKQLKQMQHYEIINNKIMYGVDAESIQKILKYNGHKMIYPQYQCSFVTNRIPNSQVLTDKRLLFQKLKDYFIEVLEKDLFQMMVKTVYMPTFQQNDYQYLKVILGEDRKKLWLCKPGQGFSDADGIDFLQTKDVVRTLKQRVHLSDISNCTYIVQEYLTNPFLYKKRKVDLCHYLIISIVGGGLKIYWYPQGYFRTSNLPYNIKSKDKQVHFLGEGVQKENKQFGKHQVQNKINYFEFQKYLDRYHQDDDFSVQDIIDQMKQIALTVVKSVLNCLDPQRKGSNFQIFRFNYLLDAKCKVYFLEVQKNPSLNFDIRCKTLSYLIPTMIDQTLQLIIDPLFPPQNHFPPNQYHRIGADIYKSLKLQCIYDEHRFVQ